MNKFIFFIIFSICISCKYNNQEKQDIIEYEKTLKIFLKCLDEKFYIDAYNFVTDDFKKIVSRKQLVDFVMHSQNKAGKILEKIRLFNSYKSSTVIGIGQVTKTLKEYNVRYIIKAKKINFFLDIKLVPTKKGIRIYRYDINFIEKYIDKNYKQAKSPLSDEEMKVVDSFVDNYINELKESKEKSEK